MKRNILTLTSLTTFALFITGIAGTLAVTGCGDSGEKQPSVSVKPASESVRKLAFVTNVPADFWNIAKAGIEAADAELPNYTVEFRVGDGTAAKQKEIVEDLIVKGVVGIAISPVDAGNQTVMLNKAAEQALLICQDSDAPNSKRAFYLGTDNVAAGRAAGEMVKQALPNGGTVMAFVGKKDQQNAKERFHGLNEALKDSNVKVLDLRADDGDRARAKSNAADALTKYPDIGCMVGLWAYNAPAILGAIKDANQLGKVKVVAFDEEDQTLEGVKNGSVFGTVVQQPYEFGYQSMKLMAQHLAGDTSFLKAEKLIFVPTQNIKADNVDAFWAKLKKQRGQ